jgi:3-dehydroquinate dehydratase
MNDLNLPGARAPAVHGATALAGAERICREAGTRLGVRGYALTIAALRLVTARNA